MIVTCESCRSRFQLDEALLKGSKGARIRCRNCGGMILVRNEAAPETAGQTVFHHVEDMFLPQAEEAEAVPSDIPRRKPRARRFQLLAAGLSFLALAAASVFLARPWNIPAAPDGTAPASVKPPAEKAAYEIRDTEGYPGRTADGKNFFVVHGTVANVGKGASDGIRVRASLLGMDNQVIRKGESFAGNLIDKGLLPYMTQARVDEFLDMRYGERNSNRNIPAGGSLPFMVVCFGSPVPVGSVTVEAVDAGEPTGR